MSEPTPSVPAGATVSSSALPRLRLTAMAASLTTLIQGGLAIAILTGSESLTSVHGIIGYVTFVLTLVAAWFAYSYRKVTGDSGIFFHALSLPVLAIAQIGLAEMGQKWVHVVLGVAFLVGVVGLFAMADKKYRGV